MADHILQTARQLRERLHGDVHEQVVEAIFADAARIAGRSVSSPDQAARPTLERTVDRIVTSRIWGFPIMLGLFTVIFWLTISGANVPSGLLADLLVGKIYPWLREGAASLGFPWWLRLPD